MTYAEWIASHVPTHPLGECKKYATEMAAAFPELTLVAGHVETMGWGRRGHWWLETPSGDIVDPTARQFHGPILYSAWDPTEPVRLGKCMNCGEEIWECVESLDKATQKGICGDRCEREFIAYLMGDEGNLRAQMVTDFEATRRAFL